MPRNLVRFEPFAELDNLQKRFFDDGFLAPFRGGGSHFPATDVYTEDDKQLTVEARLADFEEKDISVDIDGDALVIQAERHEREEDKKKKYVIRESTNSYYRRITLPEQADRSKVQASFSKGVLKVVVPFADLPAPTRIPITS